jgi:hypothetical protein
MSVRAIQAVLRGGPSHGLKVTALFDPAHRALDCVSRSGYTYRDSGRSLHGLQIYDWLPGDRPADSREVPLSAVAPSADLQVSASHVS